ncbi:unnamed protein product [Adineta ricciae]|uniref:HAT C-terminal dimerisation domain-containing protein n=1 Tax=Adineta ricciae TaxID=249248 RepID=A0A815C780_ADIRI|nr:unnamed protein product [Adineta ricciae]
MPLHKTKFNASWLEKLDFDNTPVKRWLKQGGQQSTFVCTLCKTGDLCCGNKGWQSIECHMKNKKHSDNLKLLKENNIFTIRTESNLIHSEQSSSSNVSMTTPAAPSTKNISFSDQVTRAETLWAMNAARHGYSYLSCDGSSDLFKKMFPDSNIAQQIKMERVKLSYVISHGLGPFFHRGLIQDIKQCERFVLCFDEQKNHQNSKQLDLLLKYWSVQKQCVVTRYYKSVLLGHAPAHTIRDSILDSFRTDGIDIKRLLMIGRDNPNVNKTIEKLLDEELKKVGGELLKIGPCHIHVVHNAFKAGTTKSCWHIHTFCIDIWSWFRHSPARKEDFANIADELDETIQKTILYFVCTRWVLLGKVVDRILKLSDLYRVVLLSFVTIEHVGNKQGGELLSVDYKLAEKQLNDKQIKIGEETRKSLTLLSKDEKETFFQDVRNIFHSIALYLKSNLPLHNSFLRDLKILGVSYRSDPQGCDAIVRIGRYIPGLLSVNEIDLLSDEWLLYSIETIDDSWVVKRKYNDVDGKEHIEYHEIDFYWDKILSIVRHNGCSKYPTLSKLIKNILIISHGNADVERGFSINGNILTEDRTLLSEKSINGLRATYDAKSFSGNGSVHKVPINIEMLRAVQKSAASYKDELLKNKTIVAAQEQVNKQREKTEIEKKKLLEQENELMSKYKKLQTEQKTAQLLLEEGNQRIGNSLRKRDFTDIQAAYALNKIGTEKMKIIDEDMSQIMKDISMIQQKRAHADREQSNKKRKLAAEQVLLEENATKFVK